MRFTHPANGGKLNEMVWPRLTIFIFLARAQPADCDVPPNLSPAHRISHYPSKPSGLHAHRCWSFGRAPNRARCASRLRSAAPVPAPGTEDRKTPEPGQSARVPQDLSRNNQNGKTWQFQNFLGKPLDFSLTKKLNITGAPERGGNHGVLSRMRDGSRHR